MSGRDIFFGLFLSGIVATSSSRGWAQETLDEVPERTYSTIVDRNPFGLKPPPPPPPPEEKVEPPVETDIKLTGISSFGMTRAYFMITAKKEKTSEYYALGVDEKKDELEVLEIDESSRSVRIRKSGVETLLTFMTHGIAAPAGGGKAKAPGVVRKVGVPVRTANARKPTTNATRGNTSKTTPPRGVRTIPSRTVRTQSNSANSSIAARYGLQRGSNTRRVPTPATSNNTMSSEEQALLLELQRYTNPSLNLPPTPGIPQPIAPGGAPGLPALPGQ